MDKKIIIIHKICFTASIFILSASLLYYLFKWNSFPEEIGVHFGPDGEYDVIASKVYGFYPHVVGGIFIAGLAFANTLVHKKTVGLRISEKGEKLFKTELSLTLDSLSFLVSIFFANWSRTVSLQTALNLDFVRSLIWLMLACAGIGMTAQIITCQKFKLKKEIL